MGITADIGMALRAGVSLGAVYRVRVGIVIDGKIENFPIRQLLLHAGFSMAG